MGGAYGLQTHIWNNNWKTVLLMAGFPVLLLLLTYALFLLFAGLTGTYYGNDPMTGYFMWAGDALAKAWPYAIAGAILWFADVAASVLVLGPGEMSEGMRGFPLAISLNANLLGNQSEGSFQAISTFVKRGRTVSVVRTVVCGAADKLIADVTTSHVLSR